MKHEPQNIYTFFLFDNPHSVWTQDLSDKRFQIIPNSYSKIDFSNAITATDSFSVIDFYCVYNGGGIAIGDFNNVELQDVYFEGHEVSYKIYLNQTWF